MIILIIVLIIAAYQVGRFVGTRRAAKIMMGSEYKNY